MSLTNAKKAINRTGSFSLQEKRILRTTLEETYDDIVALQDGSTARSVWEFFDDFNMKALDETNENWILNAGTDAAALDPAVVIAENGTIFCDAGPGNGTVAEDASQIVLALPVQTDGGGLEFGGRLAIEDITKCSVNIGLTDSTAREEPFSIATATVTSVATDAVCFVYDNGATLKEWYTLGVSGDTEATGNASSGIAPVSGAFQTFRCVIDADGEGARFYIDDVLAGTLTAKVAAITTNLYLTAIIVGDGSNVAASGLTIDNLYVRRTRS